MPPVEDIVTISPLCCFRIIGSDCARHVHRPEKVCLDLRAKVLRRNLFEESRVKVPRIVDQYVDPPEPVCRRFDRRLRVRRVDYIQPYYQQIVRSPDRLRHFLDISACRDRLISSRQSRLRNVLPHAPPGTGNKQYFPFAVAFIFRFHIIPIFLFPES